MYNQIHTNQNESTFFAHVFGWMSAGLGVTAGTAYYIAYQQPQILQHIIQSPWLLIALFLVQIGLVVSLASLAPSLPFGVALSVFFGYAMLNGVTLSSIVFEYTQESLALTFGIAAAMFLVMALFGYTTRINLAPVGIFGIMALCGIIIASIVNLFLKSSTMELVLSAVGVVVFAALTAYDIQKLRMLPQIVSTQNRRLTNLGLLGALMLYLDFINLFIMLLRFTGNRRD